MACWVGVQIPALSNAGGKPSGTRRLSKVSKGGPSRFHLSRVFLFAYFISPKTCPVLPEKHHAVPGQCGSFVPHSE